MGAVHPRGLALLQLWGQPEAAERFRRETGAELQHAERLVQRMLALGVAPAASQLRPVQTGPDLASLLRLNAALEPDPIQHYAGAVRFCVLIGDAENDAFLRALWSEEQEHGEELARWRHERKGGFQALEVHISL